MHKNEKMKGLYLIFGVNLLLATQSIAQYATGAIYDAAYFKKDEAELRRLGRSMAPVGQVLPRSVSLRAWCPTVGNQCKSSSCVAWAIGYAAMTIRLAEQRQIKDRERIDALALSASYIFNKSSSNCDGLAFSMVESVLKTGVCPAYLFPNLQICNQVPTQTDSLEAAPFKVRRFQPVFLSDASIDDKLLAIKRTLNARLPIVVQVRVDSGLFYPENGVWKPRPSKQTLAYDHALCLIGYDDSTRTFELMNSWGTDWGDKGFVHIAYPDFLENALEENGLLKAAYQLDLYPVEPARFRAEAVLERLANNTTCVNRSFERIHIKKENNIYKTVKQRFTRRDEVRLLFPNVDEPQYVYFFGQDAGTGVWTKYADTLLRQSATILPDKKALLNFTAEGTEIICCLFSEVPIVDFETRLQNLPTAKPNAQTNGILFETLKKQFPNVSNDLEMEKMAFRNGQMALMTVVLEIR
jgi:Papain family cysteine protease